DCCGTPAGWYTPRGVVLEFISSTFRSVGGEKPLGLYPPKRAMARAASQSQPTAGLLGADHAREFHPTDLATPRHREAVEEPHEVRDFVIRQRYAAEILDLLARNDRPLDQ